MPYGFSRWSVGIVVKKITSKSGSLIFILFARASILVKCPKPTPFVGNMITQFPLEFNRPDAFTENDVGWAFHPINSKPIMNIIHGSVMTRNGALHGLFIASVMCEPKRNDGELRRR